MTVKLSYLKIGYKKLKDKDRLDEIMRIKSMLTNCKVFDDDKNFTINNSYNLSEISTRQFLLFHLLGYEFNKSITKYFANNEEKSLIYPLPYSWKKNLKIMVLKLIFI